jgi:hypothetical protein
MKPEKPIKYGIGCIILDFFLIVEAIIDVRTGRTTGVELFAIITLSITLAAVLVALIKKHIRKKKDQFNSSRTDEQEGTNNTGE